MRHGMDPVLSDFELSRDVTPGATTRTRTTNLSGTPEFMAPEQLDEGKRGGLEADMWALGVLLLKVRAPADTSVEWSLPRRSSIPSGRCCCCPRIAKDLLPRDTLFLPRRPCRRYRPEREPC